MKENFFKIGYSSYLSKKENKFLKWTNIIVNKILQHKILLSVLFTIVLCCSMNFLLIYKFMNILASIN